MNLSQSIDYILWSALWMSWNMMLALISVALALFISKSKSVLFDLLALPVWLLFLPNTLYMITDGMYVYSEDFGNMNFIGMALGVCLYAVIVGIAPYTYYWSIKPVLKKYKKSISQLGLTFQFVILLFSSFLIALGITMGRFARTNSWHVFTQPGRIYGDILHIFKFQESQVFLTAYFLGISVLNIIILIRNKNSYI